MLLSVEDYRKAARRRLPRFVFEYVDGAAEDERCLQRNRDALDSIGLLPQCLRNTTTVSTSIEVFGQTWQQPFAVAPTGFNGLLRPKGDLVIARAAASAGVPFLLSTASNTRSLVWDSIGWLRQLWDGPILLKGLLHHEDARGAARAGIDGIIVSNHGGRQLDAGPARMGQATDAAKDVAREAPRISAVPS
jgi:isopentenyl diphosphate isomerase/L-lactate dehydrogenase-like FMN-dependent dehydrogenase